MVNSRVLLVDDERDFVEALAARLAMRGLKPDIAYDGEQAISAVQVRTYDAVVLDLVMPGPDGIETLRRILEIDPDLQVILLTGHGDLEAGLSAMKTGAADFLQKPADLTAILSRIETAAVKKMLLVEKQSEAEVAEILRRKGW